VVEHMVDAVASFEGDGAHHFRILRAMKNRFGPTDEIGVFEMTGDGLAQVTNPSALFLSDRDRPAPGSASARAQRQRRPRARAAAGQGTRAQGRPPGAPSAPQRHRRMQGPQTPPAPCCCRACSTGSARGRGARARWRGTARAGAAAARAPAAARHRQGRRRVQGQRAGTACQPSSQRAPWPWALEEQRGSGRHCWQLAHVLRVCARVCVCVYVCVRVCECMYRFAFTHSSAFCVKTDSKAEGREGGEG
jgi:hypothetical protein